MLLIVAFLIGLALLGLGDLAIYGRTVASFRRRGENRKLIDELFWKKSYAWEQEQVDDTALWDADPSQAGLTEAQTLADGGDREGAVRLWLSLAEQGSVLAMRVVAESYHAGWGVPADLERAEEWYARAFKGGSQIAALNYADFFQSRRDYAACESIFAAYAARGWPPAQFWVAYNRLKQSRRRADYLRARPLLESAATHGSPIAKRLLYYWMTRGRFGLLAIPRGLMLQRNLAVELAQMLDTAGVELVGDRLLSRAVLTFRQHDTHSPDV